MFSLLCVKSSLKMKFGASIHFCSIGQRYEVYYGNKNSIYFPYELRLKLAQDFIPEFAVRVWRV